MLQIPHDPIHHSFHFPSVHKQTHRSRGCGFSSLSNIFRMRSTQQDTIHETIPLQSHIISKGNNLTNACQYTSTMYIAQHSLQKVTASQNNDTNNIKTNTVSVHAEAALKSETDDEKNMRYVAKTKYSVQFAEEVTIVNHKYVEYEEINFEIIADRLKIAFCSLGKKEVEAKDYVNATCFLEEILENLIQHHDYEREFVAAKTKIRPLVQKKGCRPCEKEIHLYTQEGYIVELEKIIRKMVREKFAEKIHALYSDEHNSHIEIQDTCIAALEVLLQSKTWYAWFHALYKDKLRSI